MNCIEELKWVSAAELPDTDTTVLCWGDEGAFCGWWDSAEGCWRDCESGGVNDYVTHWAEPKGPAA